MLMISSNYSISVQAYWSVLFGNFYCQFWSNNTLGGSFDLFISPKVPLNLVENSYRSRRLGVRGIGFFFFVSFLCFFFHPNVYQGVEKKGRPTLTL